MENLAESDDDLDDMTDLYPWLKNQPVEKDSGMIKNNFFEKKLFFRYE